MRDVPLDLAEHLAGGVTTLCLCWKVTRADGAEFGFTDHDRSLSFGGIDFQHLTGWRASEATSGPGLAIGGQEVSGGFALEGLSESDLRAGLWDNASVAVWLVNWADTGQRLHIGSGQIGEVTSLDGAFRAEIRGLAHRLDQPRGRVFGHLCDADVGDTRCGVDITTPALAGTGTVSETDGHGFIVASGLGAFEDGWFSGGVLVWTAGGNAGARHEVKRHTKAGNVSLRLWQRAGAAIAVGDTFTVSVGCDKRFETCRTKFGNGTAFRGFPHMPGNDFALSYPSPQEDNEGDRRDLFG